MWKAVTLEDWAKNRVSELSSARPVVEEIISRVRNGGDRALLDLTRQFDGVDVDSLLVGEDEREKAFQEVDERVIASLIEADARISRFHELQQPRGLWLEEVEPGVVLGVKTTPLDRIGAYIPGGRAAYSSTALMCTIPARVAGVRSICCCSPPPISPLTLVAMDIAGVDEIYAVGGAQAIAAMALGTESIRPVQKIVGPGNIYVTMAKMLLRDHAEIDFPAGPSEIVVLADDSARAEFIAADILAQSEHDPRAASLLVTTDPGLPARVGTCLESGMKDAKRAVILEKAMENAGYLVAASMEEAVEIVNHAAAEHLSLQVADPMGVLHGIRCAGAVFLGNYAAVACGDYASGTNHVLPTAGYAQVHSGLDVQHFCRRSTVQLITREGLEGMGDTVETIAEAEGLVAHARSVRIRRELH
ncbi:MAG: bifunctional histidinal dehydrogenase/ histidinol dehydrogenase [Methanoregulaceae archaeon PtaB.Bin009]|jgi:histidinol dehydrogenase|nr:MAG: bifunctional histidinal dehydrogenase/ histidinol dehydrogenase [Methanoregulaceae archaeon PtaB.Bin009]OPY42509.1 MAG: bifunctional histidinal dehydrogenase/ histidinol dehydrogenase [Methanoregulaceae archaeon PtaU1.Bin066]HNQ30812.1 histidinol dehydrogenase [Methanolinea sp.]